MDNDPTNEGASGWTLGKVREQNLQLEAKCQTEGCNWFCTFDLGKLIDDLGADCELPADGPGVACQICGATNLKFQLAYLHPDNGAGGE